MKTFADRLVETMKLRGHTSDRTLTGINMATLEGWTGKSYEMCRRYVEGLGVPRRPIAKIIADNLEVSVSWLLDGTGAMESDSDLIDRDRLAECFNAARNASEKLGVTLSDQQLIDAALHLYLTED